MSSLIDQNYGYLLELFARELLVSCKIMTKETFTIKKVTKEGLHFTKPGKLFLYPVVGKDEKKNKTINGFVGLYFNNETYSKLIPYIFNIDKTTKGFDEIGGELLNMCVGRAKKNLSDEGLTFKKNIPFSLDFDNLRLNQVNLAHSIQEIEINHEELTFSILQCFTEAID